MPFLDAKGLDFIIMLYTLSRRRTDEYTKLAV